jgi:hypothetical protein
VIGIVLIGQSISSGNKRESQRSKGIGLTFSQNGLVTYPRSLDIILPPGEY